MRAEIAEKWAKALESGEFAQGDSALRDIDDQYCCLGVLCELAIREGGTVLRWRRGGMYYTLYQDQISVESHLLPREIVKWAGMRTVIGEFGNMGSLVSENDTGATFAEIAAIIRQRVEDL